MRWRREERCPKPAPSSVAYDDSSPQGEAFRKSLLFHNPQFAHRPYKQHSAEPAEMGSALYISYT